MKFDRANTAFGRHETFHLRYSWIPKGLQLYQSNNAIFSDPNKATMELGVGKNMVNAIKYWLKACQLTDKNNKITDIAKKLFLDNGYDPFLEDQTTLWIIHWLIASNTKSATTIAWFFSKYYKSEFSYL